MLKVFSAQHHAEAHLVSGILHAEGIDAEVRGESLFTLEGASSVLSMRPSVWVHEDQSQKALALIDRYSKGEALADTSAPSWSCPKCGEPHEPQFHACWQCGTERPDRQEPVSLRRNGACENCQDLWIHPSPCE